MSLTVYGASLSPYVRKVCVILKEKGLTYEQVQIDPARLPEDYSQLSPLKRIPALKDGDNVIADSGVIANYLDCKYTETTLSYEDPYLKSRVQWFEKFADYELGPLTTFGVFRNRVLMKMMGQPCNEEYVDKCLQSKLPPLLDYLEENAPQHGFIVGEKFTVADIAIGSQFVNMGFGKEKIDPEKWPKAAAYVERIHARDSFAPMIAQETAFIEKILNRLN